MFNWLEKYFTGVCYRKLKNLEHYHQRCLQEKSMVIMACSSDRLYLAEHIQELTDMLASAFYIPSIDSHIQEPVPILIQPRIVPGIKHYSDVNIADASYYALSKNQWKKILGPIQREVKLAIGPYRAEKADCDDFALVMNGFVAMAFEETDLDHQGAFGIAWSKTHAYNFFIVSDSETLVYEPQSNRIIGEIRQCSGKFDTKMLWIPG